MFQFSGFPPCNYGFITGRMEYFHAGFPIQISTDRWICAPPRGFSQLVTSFIGSRCQGIRPVLFLLDLFRDMHSVAYQAFTSFRSSSVFLQKIGSRYLLLYSVFKVQLLLIYTTFN